MNKPLLTSKVKNPNWLEMKKLSFNKHSWEYELRTYENKSRLLALKASLLPEYHLDHSATLPSHFHKQNTVGTLSIVISKLPLYSTLARN